MTDDERAEIIDSFNAKSARWPTKGHCELAREFGSPLLREAFSVWRKKSGSHPWPTRAAMTPRVMKSFLPLVAIFDVVRTHERPRYRARLTGTWFDERVVPMTGQFLDEVIQAPHLEQFQGLFDLVFTIESPIRVFASGLKFQNKDFLDVEDLFAPLGDPGQTPSAILVVVTSKPRALATDQ